MTKDEEEGGAARDMGLGWILGYTLGHAAGAAASRVPAQPRPPLSSGEYWTLVVSLAVVLLFVVWGLWCACGLDEKWEARKKNRTSRER